MSNHPCPNPPYCPPPITVAPLTVAVTTTITRERLGDLVCSALEGGSTYWCMHFKPDEYPEGCKWGHEAVAAGASFTVDHDDEKPLHVDNSDEALAKALATLANEYPAHWNDFVTENDDGDTGDTFFQVLCFGEVVYG